MASVGFQQHKTLRQLEEECRRNQHDISKTNKKIILVDCNVCDKCPEWLGNTEFHMILLSQYMRSYEDVYRGSIWGFGERIAKSNFLANAIRLKLRYQYDFYVKVEDDAHQQENDVYFHPQQNLPPQSRQQLYRKLKCCGGHDDDYGGCDEYDEDDVDFVNTYILRNLHMLYSDDGNKGSVVVQSGQWGSSGSNSDGTMEHSSPAGCHYHRASKIQRIN